MEIVPVTLVGETVVLRPMLHSDIDEMFAAGGDESLWKWTGNFVRGRNDMAAYADAAIADQERGTALPFVTTDRANGSIIGSTRFGNIDIDNRKVEIGWTWITPERQRTSANTEAKLLMLTHAFETWRCIRVELKTDANNRISQNAMKRIGAVEEGTLRNHMITDSGRFRDSVYFSIIEREWPGVKQKLAAMLAGHLRS